MRVKAKRNNTEEGKERKGKESKTREKKGPDEKTKNEIQSDMVCPYGSAPRKKQTHPKTHKTTQKAVDTDCPQLCRNYMFWAQALTTSPLGAEAQPPLL